MNGLRGIAIVMVIYHHLCEPYWTPYGTGLRKVGGFLFSWMSPLYNGRFGVNLFFILSGFVLALPYERGTRSMANRSDAWTFYARRVQRLVPLYYFVILLGLFIQVRARWPNMGGPLDLLQYATFTFIYSFWHFLPPFDYAVWSLAVEVAFSVAFPLLLWIRNRSGMRALVIGSFVLALLVRLYATSTYGAKMPTPVEMTKDGPLGRIDDFVVGMAICHLSQRGRLPRGGLALLAVFSGALLVWLSVIGWDNVVWGVVPYNVGAFLHDSMSVGFGLILLGLLGSHGILARAACFAPLQLLGMMCYSLFVWHAFGITLRGSPWPDREIPYALFVTFLFSAATYRYVEFPGRTFKSLFLEYPS